MRHPVIAIGWIATSAVLLSAAPLRAADLDHPYASTDRGFVVRERRHVRRRVVVEQEVEVVQVPVPVVPLPPVEGPYGAFTYFPTHYPNYGYGY